MARQKRMTPFVLQPQNHQDTRRARLSLVVVAVALVLVAWFHELGHDEAQAWNIARAAALPWDVVANGRVEGHTPFWHAVLWVPSLLGKPFLMQLIGVALAVGAAALLLRDRPFPLVVCVAVMLGYYPFYQYGIIPRPYSLALLLTALIGSVLHRGVGPLLVRSLLCGALAFTSAFGLAMSAGLMLLVVTEAWPNERGNAGAVLRRLGPGILLYTSLAALSAWLIVFPLASTGLQSAIEGGGRIGARSFLHVIESAAFPQYDRLPLGIGAFLREAVIGRVVVALLAYAVLVAVAVHLWRRPAAVLAWLLCIAGVGYAGLYSGFVAERYAGHLFLAALALCWARDGLRPDNVVAAGFFRDVRRPSARTVRRLEWLAVAGLGGVLVFHVVLGVAAAALDIRDEQSAWRHIAADLEARRGESDFRVAATYAYDAGALSAYLDEPLYDLRCKCWTRYTDWSIARPVESDGIGARVCALQLEYGPIVTVVTRKAWVPADDEGFREIGTYRPGYRDAGDFLIRLYVTADGNEACQPLSG